MRELMRALQGVVEALVCFFIVMGIITAVTYVADQIAGPVRWAGHLKER